MEEAGEHSTANPIRRDTSQTGTTDNWNEPYDQGKRSERENSNREETDKDDSTKPTKWRAGAAVDALTSEQTMLWRASLAVTNHSNKRQQ